MQTTLAKRRAEFHISIFTAPCKLHLLSRLVAAYRASLSLEENICIAFSYF